MRVVRFWREAVEGMHGNIAKVTLGDIKRVAKRYLYPDRSILVVVGNGKEFDTPLAEFGTVREIELRDE